MSSKNKNRPYPIATLENVFHQKIDDAFGIVSDTHFGSKYIALRELEEMYDRIDEAGIRQVYHAGDLTDGWMIYKGQIMDQNRIGYEEQSKFTRDKYPYKKNMTTFIVMGNHDANYMKLQGADIVKYVCSYRPDLKYVGMYYARFKDPEDRIKLDLVHPTGTIPYAISYGTQKYLRNRPPSYHSNILVSGHRHQSWYGYYQEVHSFEAGCFTEPTDFLIRQGCAGNVGGWLVEMERDGGFIKKMRTELINFKKR